MIIESQAPGTTGRTALDLYRRACAGFGRLVHELRDADWSAPTPCAGWSVRDLVNHVAAENLWAAQLLAGRTISDVGSTLDGDRLGTLPVRQWDEAAAGALAVASGPDAMTRTVHLSFGDVPGEEYAMQLFADHLVHGWDLATAIGAPPRLEPDLVDACLAWFADREEGYRAAGVIGPRPSVPDGVDAAGRLLAAFGRSSTVDPEAVVAAFNSAFNAHDVDAVMALMSQDCVFEGTAPPDGDRHVGADAVRAAWAALFAGSPDAHFTAEETISAGDRVVVRWLYRWGGVDGAGGHVRGVDVFRIRAGLVIEKLAYVKG